MNRALVPPTIVLFLVVGCRPSANIGQPVPREGTHDTTGDPPPTDETMSAPLPKPTAACASEKSEQNCIECCNEHNVSAGERYIGTFSRCVCDSPGTCAKQCSANYCVGVERTRECRECLEGAEPCDELARTTCSHDSACRPLLECIEQSACASLSK